MKTKTIPSSAEEPKRAALYIRVSTDEQAEEGMSLDAQRKALELFCQQQEYVAIECFTDAGESARSDKRPAFQQMIATAKQSPKPFDVILVHKMDRFARNREDSAVYKALLRKELGIDVVSITERFDDSPTGKLTEGIMEVIAEFYSANLAHEVLKGMREKASRGQALGVAPLGYRIGADGRHEVVEEDAAIVRWIFTEYVDHQRGMNGIAVWLKDHGATQFGARAGAIKWSLQGVKLILQNRTYLGEFHWSTRHGESVFAISDAHPAIITPALFEQAEQRIANRGRMPRTPYGDYLLRGLGRCAFCGGGLIFNRQYNGWTKGQGRSNQSATYKDILVCERYYRYRCEKGVRNWIAVDEAEAAIFGAIQRVVDGSLTLEPDQIVWAGRERIARQIAALQRKLATVQEGFDRQLIAFEQGVLDLDDLRTAKARLLQTRAEIEEQLRGLQQQRESQAVPTDLLKRSLKSLLQEWQDGQPLDVRRRAIGGVLDHFTYDRRADALELVFRIPDA